MKMTGYFEAERATYQLGDPIWVTLVFANESDQDVYFFPPHGRADGLQARVVRGSDFELKGMTEEPEPGLCGEERLPPGGEFRQSYELTRWVVFKAPGEYEVECGLSLEVYDSSLRQEALERMPASLDIATTLQFTILQPD